MLALGTFITAIGVAWRQYRNHLRSERVEEDRLTSVKEAKEKAAAAEVAAAIAAKSAADAERAIVQVGKDLYVLGEAVDGRLSLLITEIRAKEFAAGKLEGETGRRASEVEGRVV